ncbi:MAG: RDD family protein [Bdellovibrio sp.]|nr:RDD family protein [Bdellovibrio sp.]
MVFPDLSAPAGTPHNYNSTPNIPIASVADRFVALVLDFLILSPVISLFIAGLVRQTKTYFLLNAMSQEGVVAIFLVIASVIFLTTALQAFFLYFWQATPGQLFLQMRVVSYPQRQTRLTLNQCFLRSFLWCSGFTLLAIPYLEVASHPLRRAFHERASDTLVTTLKRNYDEGPLPLESRFISSWMRMSFLFLLLFGVIGFFKTYHSLKVGAYREKDSQAPFACKEIRESDLLGTSRLDAALSLFLVNEISAECLDKEAEVSLWGDPVNSQGLAYLAKFMTAESSEQEKYFDKVCEERTSSVCAMARYMREDGELEDLELADKTLWTTQLLLADEKYTSQDYVGSLKLIEDLQKVSVLRSALEKRYVRSVWALNEMMQTHSKKGRLPASVNGDSWIDSFKEKYEVP